MLQKFLAWLTLFFKGTTERYSPSDWVCSDALHIADGIITINLRNSLKVHLQNLPIIWIPPIPDSNSMDPVFDTGILTNLANSCFEGRKHPSGWTFWQAPEPNLRYVIGVDTASGAPEGSFAAACVVNDRWEICATYQARIEPHALSQILVKMGKLYNTAELVIERNFTGYSVLEQLKDYPNISYQRDFTTGKLTNQRGWWSNDQTRSMIMTITRENLAQLKIWDINLIRQLKSYRYIKLKTKYREQAQTFDDLAIALMLAVTVRKIAGTARGFQGSSSGWNW